MSDEMDEIWVLFADDGAQAMDAMEAALLSLQDNGNVNAAATVAALFRAVHTFKGNARVLGLETVEVRAHLAEDLIGLVRDRDVPIDDEILSLLLETGDRLREMLDETARNRADVDPAATQDLVVRLQDKIARCLARLDGQTGENPDAQAGLQTDADPTAAFEPDAESESEPDLLNPDPETASPETDAAPQDVAADLPAPSPAQADPEPASPAPDDTATQPATKLAEDAAYRAIFDDMVTEALNDLSRATAQQNGARVGAVRKRLAHAARQLGLQPWIDLLDNLPQDLGLEDADRLTTAIDTLRAGDQGASPPKAQTAPAQGFFAQISSALASVSGLGLNYSLGQNPDLTELTNSVNTLCDAADAYGYVRVIAAARTLPAATDAAAFRQSELRLYEELASVEAALPNDGLCDNTSPRKLLQRWSADHIFDTLDEMDTALERLRGTTGSQADQRKLERLIRLIQHACAHFRLDVASDLSMTLLDLFSRSHMRGERPDVILMQIARGFVDTLELVFDAMREGETPDTDRLEQLFREAADAGFIGAGTATASSIERRLGLPTAFHRVLSPDSTRAASAALDAGRCFYILRADINTDNVLAEGLFDLIGSGRLEALTNVTVFVGDQTIFDFLIATELDDVQMAETLARLDPGGKKLVLLETLRPQGDITDDPDTTPPTSELAFDAALVPEMSQKLLEQLGEVAAGQAMLQNMLGDLSSTDLSETLDAVGRQNAADPRALRQALRQTGEHLNEQLRDVAQLGMQILGHLSELQHLTAALRTRPAATVLNALAALVATRARSNGFDAVLTIAGADEAVDITMLATLRNALQPYLQQRLSQPVHAPRRMHVVIRNQTDEVTLTLDDDAATPPGPEMLALIEEQIQAQGGSLRLIRKPDGGHRLHVFLPVNLVVLEGMVVSARKTRYIVPVSAIRTILQPDPSAMLRVKGGEGGQSWWLRLNADELVPVQDFAGRLSAADAGTQAPPSGQIYVVLSVAQSCVALPVDELLGQQLVLSRPLRGVMSGLPGLSGVALLSRGDVAMVVSPDSICGTHALRHSIH